jgi:hypothetical protein
MELSKYYQIDKIIIEDNNKIEIYGKNIKNQNFYIEFNQYNDKIEKKENIIYIDNLIYDYKYHLLLTLCLERPLQKLRMKPRSAYQKSGKYWNKIGNDMEFFQNYNKYMNLELYLFIHSLIMKNI